MQTIKECNSLYGIREKIKTGKRLSLEDGLELFRSTDILSIGGLAQEVRERMHGRRVFYSINLHLNHTNICSTRCRFCAFSRDANAADAYALTLDEIEARVREAIEKSNINEVHIVGGHNPDLGMDYYGAMLQRIRRLSSEIYVKAFSAPEIHDLAKRSGISIEEVLKRLRQTGLNSLPGGGAEIFDPEIRKRLCPQKISGEEWLQIHRTAHQLGIKTNATMLYGVGETDEARVEHLLKLRKLQDETHGFTAFVPLAYNSGKTGAETSGYLDLKVLSISRLLLDNISHIKVHWSATDLKFALAALSFGADDIGGTNLNEQVLHEAGSSSLKGLSSAELVRCIRDAGYEPCKVDSSYSQGVTGL